ncbi:eukaryotic translation initiation factor 4E-binding protein 3 [Esox lucius]|uniref:Eukaryotic translation initiation factor 4E-1A-binding protein n=1 Tax=Esox lucius TaxID=8010 RepID=C1BZF8_ESOLU|nr:eukaryotic translation initiation factor 4E-binding protein 3 [Esox lucius]ACO14411.1 Eukaryotic translation initiation factor 4E-1A-binding protein [Esox lucius]
MSNCNTSIGLTCPIPGRFEQSEDWTQLPDTYSQTPGGTLFSTTPGGTRIIYDRKFLLECRNSPVARTPPSCLPHIPGVTVPAGHPLGKLKEMDENKEISADEAQFVIDI